MCLARAFQCTAAWQALTASLLLRPPPLQLLPLRVQRLNHFPGMLEIARKKGLARNLANMRCGSCCLDSRVLAADSGASHVLKGNHWQWRRACVRSRLERGLCARQRRGSTGG